MEGMGGLQEMEPCWGTAGRGLTEGTGGYGTWSPPGELRDVGAWRERGGAVADGAPLVRDGIQLGSYGSPAGGLWEAEAH